jgi:mediator of RNA polymerase II transcription subunit 7
MAESQQVLPTAPFPGPPPFWKHFSRANLSRLETLQTEAASNDTPLDVKSLPLELRYLLPPAPPTGSEETYTTFHQTHIVNPASSLSATANIPAEDLAALLITPKPTTNIPAALTSLTKSLLLTFLQLTQMLAQDPTHESRYELLEHIKTVFVNIHVLINSYRPHQAREGVVNMLKDRIEDARAEIRQSSQLKERVEGFLKGLEDAQEQHGQLAGEASTTASREEEQDKRMWRMIREVGMEDTVTQDV